MDKEKYLHRIKYSGSREPNLGVLKELQKCHLVNVPFENLDIHDNIPIELSTERIFDKIVNRNRGGFCYELNGLFYELLVALNFDVKRVSARVYDQNGSYGKEFDHLAIIVSINNTEYLSDVGFGDFTFEPLRLEMNKLQKDEREEYVIDKWDDMYFRVNKIKNAQPQPVYIFSLIGREFREFKEMCVYHQTSPESHFTSKRLISLPTENGRITITGNQLKITELEFTTETEIKSELEFDTYLLNSFNIEK
ncbi:MAG: arylamine N-acetyltransferase family protein [Mesonia sp.]|uniref:arylamine N-acetyltransferase family protein n=1 Tax=Mesonia sp. TaxID=1960830 RepID=UPI003F964009